MLQNSVPSITPITMYLARMEWEEVSFSSVAQMIQTGFSLYIIHKTTDETRLDIYITEQGFQRSQLGSNLEPVELEHAWKARKLGL